VGKDPKKTRNSHRLQAVRGSLKRKDGRPDKRLRKEKLKTLPKREGVQKRKTYDPERDLVAISQALLRLKRKRTSERREGRVKQSKNHFPTYLGGKTETSTRRFSKKREEPIAWAVQRWGGVGEGRRVGNKGSHSLRMGLGREQRKKISF